MLCFVFFVYFVFFFFQAEDGIRDAQESRGLGDVYKRQVQGVMGVEEHISKVKKIRAACRYFPRHCPYYICDTKGDLIEARRARAIPVAVGWGWHDKDRLNQGKPRYFVKNQKELLALFGMELP